MKIDMFIGGIFGIVFGLIAIITHKYFGYKTVEFWKSIDIKLIYKWYLLFGIIFFIFGLVLITVSVTQ